MLVLIAAVGILAMLLVVTASVAYLVLPRGRMCPSCGGSTSPVVLRVMLRVLSRWVQWRWCSRCGWEGPGRKGPELGILDPPVDHDSGFRWGHPNLQDVPVFYWRDETETPETSDVPPVHSSGFQWGSDERMGGDRRVVERRETPESQHPSGFHFRKSEEVDPPSFQWGSSTRPPDTDADSSVEEPSYPREEPSYPRSERPWYLAWFVSNETPGFQWKSPRA